MVDYPPPSELSVLTDPEPGDIELEIDRDDDRFDTLNDAIETCTTFYSEAQGIADKIGFPFPGPQIQPTNAVELFVTPFSGDWNQIIACGDAISKAGKAIDDVGDNLLVGMGQLFAATGGAWQGEAAEAFYAHMGLHVALFKGAGLVVAQGKVVFDGLAEVAQFIAQRVIDLIDTALDLAVWLLEKIARYARPWIGWVSLGYDVATEGWGAIQDVIDGIQDLYDTIEAVFELHDAVTEWVDTIPGQLAVFEEIWAIIETVPDLRTTPILTTFQAVQAGQSAAEAQQQLNQQRQEAEQAAGEAEQTLDEQLGEVTQPEVPDGIEDVEVPER